MLLWPVAWSLLRSSARGPMDVEVRGPGFRSSGIEGTRLVLLGFRSIDIFCAGDAVSVLQEDSCLVRV